MASKFYVYLHKRKDSGVVFYVGKGTGHRAERPRTYKSWKNVVESAGGFDYEIYKDNLSESDALDLEVQLILNPNPDWDLINKSISNRKLSIDYDLIDRNVYYDPSSPSGLRHKFTKGPVIKGDVAGSLKIVNGRPEAWSVKISGRLYTCARIVWVLNGMQLDEHKVIDHIDRNVSNNNINNLRLVTPQENALNKSVSRSHSTGIPNLHFYSNGGYEYYTVYHPVNKKLTYFSVKKYGEVVAKEKALEFLNSII